MTSNPTVARQKRKTGDEGAAPGKPERKTSAIQVDRELVRMAAVVAAHDDVTISEFLGPVVGPFIRMHYERVQKEIQEKVRRMKSEP